MHFRPALMVDAVYYSDDELTGGNWSVGAYMSLPLDLSALASGGNPFSGARDRWEAIGGQDDMRHRLADMVRRDPQIRSRADQPEERKELRTVSVRSKTSESVEVLEYLTHELATGITFVDGSSGDDGNPGTYEEPKQTVQGGVDAANSPVWVWASEQPYEENVVVTEGVGLYGEAFQLVGMDGRVWGGGAHPVIVGQAEAPTIEIAGDNVTVSGFEVRHSLPAGVGLDGGGAASAAFDGIAGHNITNVEVSRNVMIDGSLRHGISLTADAAGPDFQARVLDNHVRNTGDHALQVQSSRVAADTFHIEVSGVYSDSGRNGVYIDAFGYNHSKAELFDITVNGNSHRGLHSYLRPFEDVEGGTMQISARNIMARDNASLGIGLFTTVRGKDCYTSVLGENLEAHNNNGVGISAQGTARSGSAFVQLINVVSNNNTSTGISLRGRATLDDSGDNLVVLRNVTANHNATSGLVLGFSESEGGDSIFLGENITANHNEQYGFRYIRVSAQGLAVVDMQNIELNYNMIGGYEEVEVVSQGSDAHALLKNITATNNQQYGMRTLRVDAAEDAFVNFVDSDLRDNVLGAWETREFTGSEVHENIDILE